MLIQFKFALCLFLAASCVAMPQLANAAYSPTKNQHAFLQELSLRSFRFFWEQANPENGLIPDQADADGKGHSKVASIAAVGFGLTAYCIADERQWESHEALKQRTLTTLRFFANEAETEHGFFYHFLDMKTGKRAWDCELSSVDTALLLAGVLTAREHFENKEIKELATRIYNRIDWKWMQNGKKTLTMGWKPEKGFLSARWSHYNELMLIYILAMGSPTHPIEPDAWDAWSRNKIIKYGKYTFIECPPLFTHQYSHAWIDFENKRDDYANYWANSRLATLAQQQFSVDLAKRFPLYTKYMWGLTAAAGENGYMVWGGPPETVSPPVDGSIVPCAPGGSIPFAPETCIPTLYNMYKKHKAKAWKRYGFVDSFNPHTKWYADKVLGIDVGITLLMIENQNDRFVWNVFQKNLEIKQAMSLANFRKITPSEKRHNRTNSIFFKKAGLRDLSQSQRPIAQAHWSEDHIVGKRDWQTMVLNGEGISQFAFTWNTEELVFHAKLTGMKLRNKYPATQLFNDDCIELFIDPQNNGLRWQNKEDWQIGFAPPNRSYEWFRKRKSFSASIITGKDKRGFTVRCAIKWKDLGIKPRKGLKLGVSPVVNQTSVKDAGKTEWHFKENAKSVELGILRLIK
ncbi:glucoamylase family protein [Poriferisphaera sp. WC338]|uniref:glucoamylase family protein n=1 Tax=Poriferisphaera sp. WC338 TaxID=3425129 RepID=UPI003D81475C